MKMKDIKINGQNKKEKDGASIPEAKKMEVDQEIGLCSLLSTVGWTCYLCG